MRLKSQQLENFQASALKYRPQEFDEVIGQSAITQTLENSIGSGQIPKAMLFCGPRGVGKTTCARILARKINEKELDPSVEHDFAFNVFELDAASNNTVDDIRTLIEQVRIPPQAGPFKVYIIDEVHMLSSAAFNAFLKTLEEPPAHAVFILATTEKHKIIPTILSRCQIFDFKRISVKDMVGHLQHVSKSRGVEAEEEALYLIAQKADGAMRDALSIFDRVASYTRGKITRQKTSEVLQVLDAEAYLEISGLIADGEIPSLIAKFNEISMLGFDGQHFVMGLADHFRDLLVAGSPETIQLLEEGEGIRQQLSEQSKRFTKAQLVRAIDLSTECDYRYRGSSNQRLLVEITLMKLASLTAAPQETASVSGEKKKPDFILPASGFKDIKKSVPKTGRPAIPEIPAASPIESGAVSSEVKAVAEAQKDIATETSTSARRKDEIRSKSNDSKGVALPDQQGFSALSLSSISHRKKRPLTDPSHADTLAKEKKIEPFELEEVCVYWKIFAERLEKEGKKIIASALEMAPPHAVEGHTLKVELPNETLKKELEAESAPLMQFLRTKLSNDFMQLEIEINETQEHKYVYTSEEKYNRLREKNPAIEILRKGFDLDY